MQADEWPAARMEEGGDGAWLRCVDGSDNESGGQAGKSAPVGQLHQFALQNLDAYPPGVDNVFCGIPGVRNAECQNPAALDKQFRYDRAVRPAQYVDHNGRIPPDPMEDVCAGPNTPVPGYNQPETCDADGALAQEIADEDAHALPEEQQGASGQVLQEGGSKLRVRSARELLSAVNAIKKRDGENETMTKMLTERGETLLVPRHTGKDGNDVFYADGTRSSIVKKL